jgi:hypothetical protein
MFPAVSTATPEGTSNRAGVSLEPSMPGVPAMVVTVPPLVMRRMVLFCWSAT